MDFSQFGPEVVAGAFVLTVFATVALTVAIMNWIFRQSDLVRQAEGARYRAAMGCPFPEDEEAVGGRRRAIPKEKSSAARLIESLQKERELADA